ncbi:MAG: hypothetical protein D6732_06495 [Methanobacteriota archaeon]|nr:MAG: hypothetical protein D6732_06495 [Euryarchaeota archaeon]
MKKKSDESLQRGAKLLLEGATLGMEHCPQCKMPIYILRDKTMYCATCDVKLVKEEDLNKENEEKTELHPVQHGKQTRNSSKSLIQAKIDQLSEQLQHENDPDKMIELAETIKKLEKIRDS